MKWTTYFLLMFVMLFLSACGNDNGEGANGLQEVSLDDINVLHIDHGSVKLNVESADIDSLEASLLYQNKGPGIVLDKGKQTLKIELENDITRLFNIGKMPQLNIRIPNDYKGEVRIDGSSGHVAGTELQTHNLVVKGKSGNVSLAFAKFHSDISVSVTSGKIKLDLNDDKPDVKWHLQSGSGSRSITIPLEDHEQSNKKTTGQSGSGTFEVNLKTGSGNIVVE